jgi:hypothetical protein
MIRPISLLSGLAMAAAIGHTFEVKRSVTILDRELRDIRRGTEEVEGRTQLLQAEWARLNDQERLRGLAERHLAGLSPMQSGQFQRLDEAVRRLPVAVAWNAPASPFAPRDESTTMLAQAWPATAAPAAAAPAIPAAGPAMPAAARPPAAQQASTASGEASLAAAAPPATTTRPGATPAPASSPTRAADPAAQRPSQLAEAAGPRAPRSMAVIPEAPSRAAQSLPPVAAPPALPSALPSARQAEMAARPAAPPTILAEARRNIPATRIEDSAALPPVASSIRPAVHIQRVETGSMLGGQPNGMAPPVPYIR